jgi:energy-coupling factor transporter transmembrane protein EcfT
VSTPGGRVPRPRPRTGLAVQLGQTLLVLGVLVLLAGLFLQGGPYAVGIGAALAVAGLVVFVVGLRRRGQSPRD